jgi:hypothetical protein
VEFIRSRVGLVLGIALLVVMAAGIAAAVQLVQEVTGSASLEEGESGPPFLAYPDWKPGTPGPPPWAGAGADDGDPPPFLAYPDWRRGTPGPPPWAGAKDGDPPPRLAYPDWKPGTPGPPPWAGADEDS